MYTDGFQHHNDVVRAVSLMHKLLLRGVHSYARSETAAEDVACTLPVLW
jgi:hypothetical protein